MGSSGRVSLRNLIRLGPGEVLPAALLFAWFLLSMASYYVIRPVRSTLVLFSLGPDILPWVYMGTAVATGVAVWIFARFSRAPRRLLVGGTLLLLTLSLLAWWWIAGAAVSARAAGGGAAWDWTSPVFYVWTDVFSIMAVTLFWMVANDLFGPGSAKRVFGILVAAGPAGAALGAWIAESRVEALGTVDLLLIATALFGGTVVLFLVLEAVTRGRSAHDGTAREIRPALDVRRLPAVIRTLLSSRFLLLLTLVVCLERIAPDFVDYVFQSAGKDAFTEADAWTQFMAGFEKWLNLAVLAVTVLVTPPLLARGGPGAALASVPLAILLLASVFAVFPVFPVVVALKALEQGQRHSWFKAGKELIYTVTSREVIYGIKGYIEMFLYRFSRGLAGLSILLLSLVPGLGWRGVVVASIPLALLWLWAAVALGREYRRAEGSARDEDSSDTGPVP
ncbi:MAG: hypothetical protein FJ098_13880 [Deltaproteobacteria bacterium]|nr:hypothetical protein [Deltaproteobacteria bacterium]